MKPDLEVVQIGRGESFKAWEHGCPFHTVHWHFHPEYEIHHVVATTGPYFVGDFIGEFEPGNLILTGPNLSHNWVSNIPAGKYIPLRGRVVQFTEGFLAEATKVFPEFDACSPMLQLSRRGALFSARTAAVVGPLLQELANARGLRRLELFMGVMSGLSSDEDTRSLASSRYTPDPSGFMSNGVNQALLYINSHLTDNVTIRDLVILPLSKDL